MKMMMPTVKNLKTKQTIFVFILSNKRHWKNNNKFIE